MLQSHFASHTYATHSLEQGPDIVSIKELLGHAHIQTTMVYLHVVVKNNKTVFSPLDTLFRNADLESKDDKAYQALTFSQTNQFYLNILKKRAANRFQRLTQPNRQTKFSF